jgi:hypothetical protein
MMTTRVVYLSLSQWKAGYLWYYLGHGEYFHHCQVHFAPQGKRNIYYAPAKTLLLLPGIAFGVAWGTPILRNYSPTLFQPF